MLDIEGEIGQQKESDQAWPIAPRDRDRRQPDLVDRRNDETKYDAVCRCLGHQVPDRDERRDPRIFPRVAAVPGLDEKGLDQDGDQEDRYKDRADFVGQFLEEVSKAEIKLHCRLPLVIDSAPSSKLTGT